jgi:hypothetical protein
LRKNGVSFEPGGLYQPARTVSTGQKVPKTKRPAQSDKLRVVPHIILNLLFFPHTNVSNG